MAPTRRSAQGGAGPKSEAETLARSSDAHLSDRLGVVEDTLRLAVSGLNDLKVSVSALRDKDGDNERAVAKLAAEFREANEKLISMVNAGTDERRKDREAFTAALEKATAAGLETLQKALLASVAQRVGSWLLTALSGAVLIGASWFWTRFK